jgi:regulator of sigma E protease
MTGLYFVVVVCFALAFFNLLPLPVLDGGHTFFALIELVVGKPVPRCILKVLTYIFIVILVGFMIYVTFYDVKRIVDDTITSKVDE